MFSQFSPRMGRRTVGAVAVLGAVSAVLLSTGVTFAHVSVTPATAAPDTSITFVVRVPTEKEEATTRLRVDFPPGLTVSRFQPMPGWTRQVEQNGQQLITSVTWSGGQIGPGEFQDFVFVARTPKDGGKLAFKSFQTYAGGETVAWENPEGSQERPVAIVVVPAPGAAAKPLGEDPTAGAGATAGSQATTAPAASAATASGTQPAVAASSSGSDLPLFVALGGLVLGALALVLSIASLTRRPRTAA